MHRAASTLLLLALSLTLLACDGDSTADAGPLDAAADAGAADPVVSTAHGPVRGLREDGVQAFVGIPFAAPPIGPLRWAPPAPPEPWTEPRAATSRPERCSQSALGFDLASSEDCLYLNVHAPDPLPAGAPVMVWMHGGAFIFGEGLQTDDGTAGDVLAREHGVVVVSMNYRLGSFGFLAHPALTAEGGGASGNYGLMDQRAALEWVQANIEAFGGDPDNVTIVGESAGGLSVCMHMISEASEGLFHRVISQSGLCDSGLATLSEHEVVGEGFAASLECTGADALSCLRAKSAEELLEVDQAGTDIFGSLSARTWWPIVDGSVITADFRARVMAGEAAAVPTILGWNANEGTLFIMLAEQGGTVVDDDAYAEAIPALALENGVDEAALRAQYPRADYPDAGTALAEVIGDSALACPSRRAARLLAEAGNEVRVYHFTFTEAAFQLPPDRELGAFHSAEVQYVFGHPAEVGRRRFTGAHVALHEAISGYWARFFSGDPGGEVSWPTFALDTEPHLRLDTTIEVGNAAHREACAIWDAAR